MNAILCLALFGHALFATLCYADVLPENVRFVYFTGHHPAMSAARTAVFALTECVPVAAYLALFGHIPEKQARNLSVEGDGYVPLRSEGLAPIDAEAPLPPSALAPVSPAIDVRPKPLEAPQRACSEQSVAGSPASLAFSGGTPNSLSADARRLARMRERLAAPQAGVDAISPHEILQSYGRGRKSAVSRAPPGSP